MMYGNKNPLIVARMERTEPDLLMGLEKLQKYFTSIKKRVYQINSFPYHITYICYCTSF